MSNRKNERPFDSHDLIVPIYLDDSRLLDVFAALEGGFSLIEKVTTQDAASQGIDRNIKGEIGADGILAKVFKIGLEANRTQKATSDRDSKREAERYFTAGSLLQRLRSVLIEKDAIHQIDDSSSSWDHVKPSDFVEIRGLFRPNPLMEGLTTLLLNMNFRRDAVSSVLNSSQTVEGVPPSEDPNETTIRKLINGILPGLEQVESQANMFLVEVGPQSLQVVVKLFKKYLRDPSMTELSYGKFVLFGKVTQNLAKDQTIDLLRGTGFGTIGDTYIDGLIKTFNDHGSQMAKIPKIITKVEWPALQVIPIAIYI